MQRFPITRRSFLGAAAVAGAINSAHAEDDFPDLSSVKPDLALPPVSAGDPAPGKRVRQTNPDYQATDVHHLLYLPRDWVRGRRYPVIVEYAGNGNYSNRFGDVSTGEVEGSKLGYGISGGNGFLWVCAPYVNRERTANEKTWWGDIEATAGYVRETVRLVCERYGGDPSAVILAGFSRGAIGCNYIGLHDEETADVWLAFLAYSHYDGVITTWPYDGADRDHAAARLARLKGRAVFICQEQSSRPERGLAATKAYVEASGVRGPFTYEQIPFRNHNDAWTLRNIPARRAVRRWLADVLKTRPGTHSISGHVRDSAHRAIAGVRVASGYAHWTATDARGKYEIRGLIDSDRKVVAERAGLRFSPASRTVSVSGRDITNIDFAEEESTGQAPRGRF